MIFVSSSSTVRVRVWASKRWLNCLMVFGYFYKKVSRKGVMESAKKIY
jgi:hypothetical protein